MSPRCSRYLEKRGCHSMVSDGETVALQICCSAMCVAAMVRMFLYGTSFKTDLKCSAWWFAI
ncbi:hypothetical protein BDU57DRAFT_12917 [Ampelomyces quisqualis]|uniref:Uncharacterized protein n=1 Tax=Ampelomyces quisqualis TaxID=50730 RepID=A0A6A5QZY4_AMPQU|nr:hypothetical protein BDU57DRAFT_12917 [Ampelomyces quisqualis]